MLWESWRLSNSAQGKIHLRRERVEGAIEARGQVRHNHTSLPLQPLGTTVQERNNRRRIGIAIGVFLHHAVQCGVHPPAGWDIIQASHNNVELPVKSIVPLLNLTHMGCDPDAHVATPLIDKCCGSGGLGLAHVRLSKQELAIQVGHIDGVKVNNVNVAEPTVGQTLEDFTPESAGPNHKHTGDISHILSGLRSRGEGIRVSIGALALQDPPNVVKHGDLWGGPRFFRGRQLTGNNHALPCAPERP
mmetsp:Transcript_39546/g.86309  ORF Transcript_39546/g.86309 Transcript_39546/m.86309 type:complete len:246 (-) Transcript_39546:25-762(-)